MAPTTSPKSSAQRRRRPPSPPPKKYRSMDDIMSRAEKADLKESEDEESESEEDDVFSRLMCEECGDGDKEDEMLVCDGCDRGYHMMCARPIVVRVPIGKWYCSSCSPEDRLPLSKSLSQTKLIAFFQIRKCDKMPDKGPLPQDTRRRRRRSTVLAVQKKKRRFLAFAPTNDDAQRLLQMSSLANALKTLKMEFSDELTYKNGMAPRSANQAEYEVGGMQVLPREDLETLQRCKAMYRNGQCPPLLVVFDSLEGFTVQADGPIKDMTLIAEYTGDVDYNINRERDDCDSIMCLLLTKDPSDSLVICPDRRGNIARFISGINNHDRGSKKKLNVKCVRYNVDGECRVLLVATRDIAKGERLYYDYNGYMHEYPTHHFV